MNEIKDFQLPLFGSPDTNQVVNVASVPQRSPFRYPGGKTWLVPIIRQWLVNSSRRPIEFIEPFAGGSIIGLTVAFENLADHVTLVEIDPNVAAVWKTIIYGNYEKLAHRILTFDLTPENVEIVLTNPAENIEDKAFQTIIKNRVNRGGILAPGAGRIKNGENGKGIRSRWYPATLCRRIKDIGKIRNKFTFIEGDGIQILKEKADQIDTCYFIDPPYTVDGKKAGARLYAHFNIDHELLFSTVATLKGDFLMTYDNVLGVNNMADRCGFMTRLVAMKNTHNAEMSELLIGRDLFWLNN